MSQKNKAIQFWNEDGQAVWVALTNYRNAQPVNNADFTDALIINKSKHVASKEKKLFEGSYTFDLAAQTLPGAKIP